MADITTIEEEIATLTAQGEFFAAHPELITQQVLDVIAAEIAQLNNDLNPCFVAGTAIKTTEGDVAVEDLVVGQQVVTSRGVPRPVRWLGHRTVAVRGDRRAAELAPVRIGRGALGENRPKRDLLVSPGHSICFDVLGEVLIPAGALINGATIQQDDVDEVTYWHVELDSHDILLAEDQPAESYLEMDNRGFFSESNPVHFAALPDAPASSHADFCRPFHGSGAIVEAVNMQLRHRAAAAGWLLDESDAFAGLHLVADGKRIDPTTRGLAARFAVPAGVQDVWLVSSTVQPRSIGLNADPRQLGLHIAAISFEDGFGNPRRIALDDPLLCVGFHEAEADGLRWTSGRARLPAALWADLPDEFYLRLDLAGPSLPRWLETKKQPAPALEAA